MSDFLVNKDMFGRYCYIPTDHTSSPHLYKDVVPDDEAIICPNCGARMESE